MPLCEIKELLVLIIHMHLSEQAKYICHSKMKSYESFKIYKAGNNVVIYVADIRKMKN